MIRNIQKSRVRRVWNSAGRTYAFGPFVLNVTERQLLRSGEPVPLTPKAFETLSVLVSNHGHMVSKKGPAADGVAG